MKLFDTQAYFEPGIPPEGSIAPYSVRILSVERSNSYRQNGNIKPNATVPNVIL
jgi:hypothetical protein